MNKVSVIVPVYNVEKYLPRCLDCIVGQTLKEIEIVCVDDGSTDGSGAILDGYAKRDGRIRVIHQANAGAGAARNVGLAIAKGEYLFFFDPDDTASRRMLKAMYAKAVATCADIVVAGKAMVDGRSGRMIAKYGFVSSMWSLKQPFSGKDAAAKIFNFAKSVPWDKLFRREFVQDHGILFQEIPRSNDMYFVNMSLALADRIALIPHAYYRYHLFREGSLQTEKARHPTAFVGSYGELAKALSARGLFPVFRASFVTAFFATVLVNLWELKGSPSLDACYRAVRDLLLDWSRSGLVSEAAFPGKHEKTEYRAILANESPEPILALIAKYGDYPGVDMRCGVVPRMKNLARCVIPLWLRENVKRVMVARGLPTIPGVKVEIKVDFILLSNHSLKIDYSRCGLVGDEQEFPETVVWSARSDSGHIVSGKVTQGASFIQKADGVGKRLQLRGRRYSVEFDLTPGSDRLQILAVVDGTEISWRKIGFGDFAPLNGRVLSSYFRSSGRILRRRGEGLELVPDSFFERLGSRLRLVISLIRHPRVDAIIAAALSAIVVVLKAAKRRPLWLISDRDNRADDNGRALFEYIMSLPDDGSRPDCRFAISRKCPDWDVMRRIGRTVDINGWWYKLMFLTADAVISAYRAPIQRMPFRPGVVSYLRKAFSSDYRFVFLRHGICEKDISHVLCRQKIDLMLMMTSARGEFLDVQRPVYGYSAEQVRLCGMPRYDKLYDDRRGFITFMPTFRGYLMAGLHTNALLSAERFRETPFYRCYHAVFSNRAFVESCAKAGFKVRIMMHPNMRGALGELGIDENIEVLPADTSYREVFATSDLVVTDYSSVAFDFAYLKKPIVYYQFDYSDYYGEQYRPAPYFEYARNGFGEIETEPEMLKRRILEYAAGGCRMKPEYVRRVDDFYAFRDKGNCRRVYECIQRCCADRRGWR